MVLIVFISAAEEKKHYLNMSYVAAKGTAADTKKMATITAPTVETEGTILRSTNLTIRTTGRQVYGSTRDMPCHEIHHFTGFEK